MVVKYRIFNILKCLFILIFAWLWYIALFNHEKRFYYYMPNELFTRPVYVPYLNYFFRREKKHSAKNSSSDATSNFCILNPNELRVQPVDMDANTLTWREIEAENGNVAMGGSWAPTDCKPAQRVAVILPYRKRQRQLKILIKRLHKMLQKQKLVYQIFVVNQVVDGAFNRGLAINVAVKEILRGPTQFDCLVMNDVDLVPEHDMNLYTCHMPASSSAAASPSVYSFNPVSARAPSYATPPSLEPESFDLRRGSLRQLSSAIDDTRYHVMFWNNGGGVVSIPTAHYLRMNGHPNLYWGWGNEDDDFSARSYVLGIPLTRPPEWVGRFKMVKHLRGYRNERAFDLFYEFLGRMYLDGFNSLVKVASPEQIRRVLARQQHIVDSVSSSAAFTSLNSAVARNLSFLFEQPYFLYPVEKHRLYTNLSALYAWTPHLYQSKSPKFPKVSWFWFFKFYGWI